MAKMYIYLFIINGHNTKQPTHRITNTNANKNTNTNINRNTKNITDHRIALLIKDNRIYSSVIFV